MRIDRRLASVLFFAIFIGMAMLLSGHFARPTRFAFSEAPAEQARHDGRQIPNYPAPDATAE
jgi:hypothetical protein